MAVNLSAPGTLTAVPGVSLVTASAGIKQRQRDDMLIAAFAPETVMAGVFTQSSFAAAPVLLCRERLGQARAWVVNSGNANAATGEPGLQDARQICSTVAAALTEKGVSVSAEQVLPFSTGVIGERLPVAAMESAVRDAIGSNFVLSEAGDAEWQRAAIAIMTTDTVPKAVSRTVTLGGVSVAITGIAKGSGMIKPDMATLLGFMATDAVVEPATLTVLAAQVADASFNRVTIDGDTSTNDSFVLAATGAAGHAPISLDSPDLAVLLDALTEVAVELAIAMARDGEGATKFVTVRVAGGATRADCLKVAYTVAESPLVKTALFAGDPNWGRFCMAIGRSGVKELEPSGVNLFLDDVCIARGGLVAAEYEEAQASEVMANDEFVVHIDLGMGDATETVWTSDFSYEYVRINAEYRT